MGKYISKLLFWIWVLGLPYSYGYFKDFRTKNAHKWRYSDVPVCYFFTMAWPVSLPVFMGLDKLNQDAGVF